MMRHLLVNSIINTTPPSPDLSLTCYYEHQNPKSETEQLQADVAVSQDDVITEFYSSQFCLMLPGDAASSRRVVEAIKYGCVPVFVGPPFHAEVLPRHIDFGGLGVVVKVDRAFWEGLAEEDGGDLVMDKFWQVCNIIDLLKSINL